MQGRERRNGVGISLSNEARSKLKNLGDQLDIVNKELENEREGLRGLEGPGQAQGLVDVAGLRDRFEKYKKRKERRNRVMSGIFDNIQKFNVVSRKAPKTEEARELGRADSTVRQFHIDAKQVGICFINPQGVFKKCWESLKLLLLMYTFAFLPLKATFLGETQLPGALNIFDNFIDGVFFVDLVFNFFTPVILKFEYEYRKKELAKAYLKGWFTLDLISVVPFEELTELILGGKSNLSSYIDLIKLLRLLRLLKLIRLFKAFDAKSEDNYIIIGIGYALRGTPVMLMLPNFLIILVFAHIASCIWYFLADANTARTSWIDNTKLQDADTFKMWTSAFYFIIQTVTTTGYGDIISSTSAEIVFRIVCMCLGNLIYGLFSGQVVDFRAKRMEVEEVEHERLVKLNEIAKICDLPEALFHNIEEKIHDGMNQEKRQYEFSNLTKDEIDTFDYNMLIQKFAGVNLLSENIKDKGFVMSLGRAMKKKEFLPDQPIFHRDEPAILFYIIKSGTVSFMLKGSEDVPIYRVSKGFFGEYEIIHNVSRVFTVKAQTPCLIYFIDSIEFKKLFLTSPDLAFCDKFKARADTRFQAIDGVNKEMEFFLRRKFFWRMILGGRKKKQKQANTIHNIITRAVSDVETKHPSGKTLKPALVKDGLYSMRPEAPARPRLEDNEYGYETGLVKVH